MKEREVLNSFMNDNENSFMDQFEVYNMYNLEKRSDYKEFQDAIDDLELKYPKVQHYLEDEKITDMSDEEKLAVLKIFELSISLKNIEIKEAFKLGGKEMLIYLKEMDLLKI